MEIFSLRMSNSKYNNNFRSAQNWTGRVKADQFPDDRDSGHTRAFDRSGTRGSAPVISGIR